LLAKAKFFFKKKGFEQSIVKVDAAFLSSKGLRGEMAHNNGVPIL